MLCERVRDSFGVTTRFVRLSDSRSPVRLDLGHQAEVMLCAAAVLLPRFGSAVRLPDDIPVLVGQAYGQAVDAPHSWSAALDDARRRWMDDAMRRTEKAKNFGLVAWCVMPSRRGAFIRCRVRRGSSVS